MLESTKHVTAKRHVMNIPCIKSLSQERAVSNKSRLTLEALHS